MVTIRLMLDNITRKKSIAKLRCNFNKLSIFAYLIIGIKQDSITLFISLSQLIAIFIKSWKFVNSVSIDCLGFSIIMVEDKCVLICLCQRSTCALITLRQCLINSPVSTLIHCLCIFTHNIVRHCNATI